MKIAAAQFSSVPGDVGANVETMRDLVRTASEQGVRLVVFAELAVTGYGMELIAGDPGLWLTEDDPRLGPVREACRETGTAAVVNAAVLTADGRPGISSLVIGPDGERLARYDKRNLHGVELDICAAGTEDGRFTLDGVRFALAVCYDNRFPELAERARKDGCQVYLASSVLEEGNDSFESVYPVRARENGLYVVMANQVGPSDIGVCPGDSGIWGPDGTSLATAAQSDPGLAVAEPVFVSR
ncbi:hydrolase [Streptomyces inusitatus]|uniref:Hydrolase n=1 Tax=Streptomyces inusitatus TaxID=68221 RepID=A0A918PVW8_9ACTN|nr:carbon-nitrogen hydrolase family protein [Streptomyces inusitatus]GGZ22674.1 hydrolase [Streptomyces inusitatus]